MEIQTIVAVEVPGQPSDGRLSQVCDELVNGSLAILDAKYGEGWCSFVSPFVIQTPPTVGAHLVLERHHAEEFSDYFYLSAEKKGYRKASPRGSVFQKKSKKAWWKFW